MTSSETDVDQVLKRLASQSMKQGTRVRVAVRDLTLKALQQRELTLEQIRKVLRSVTEGVSLGVGKREVKVEKALSDTVAGMDDALRKAVEASNLALHRMTGEGYDYEDSNLKRALDELEHLEDAFLASIVSASEAGERIDQGALAARARQDQGVRHRHRQAGGGNPSGLREAYAGGHARTARDGFQDGASRHAELRHPRQRNTDRHVPGTRCREGCSEDERSARAQGRQADTGQDRDPVEGTGGEADHGGQARQDESLIAGRPDRLHPLPTPKNAARKTAGKPAAKKSVRETAKTK